MVATSQYNAFSQERAKQARIRLVMAQSQGSALGGGLLGGEISNSTTTASNNSDPLPGYSNFNLMYHYSQTFQDDYNQNYNFIRLNKRVSITAKDRKNNRFQEPLDELRLEVAEWLN